MKRVIIESPYAGNVELNLRYLRACMHDSLVNHGEAPYASHGLYTQPGVLDDRTPASRSAGIHAGFAWRELADATVVYTDLGISKGMQYGIEHAAKHGKPIEYRTLGGVWAEIAASIEDGKAWAEIMAGITFGDRAFECEDPRFERFATEQWS